MQNLSILPQLDLSIEISELLSKGLSFEAKKAKNLHPTQNFQLKLKDEKNQIHGGLTGLFYYGCLYIDQLWIKPQVRQKGWGSKLIKDAERLAKDHLCKFATVCTMDWEAKEFYLKLGYQVEFIRKGYTNDSKMIFLRKEF